MKIVELSYSTSHFSSHIVPLSHYPLQPLSRLWEGVDGEGDDSQIGRSIWAEMSLAVSTHLQGQLEHQFMRNSV